MSGPKGCYDRGDSHHHDRNELLNRSVSLKFPCPGTPETREKPLPPLLRRSSDSSSAIARRQQQKTGSGMYHPIVKEQVIPGQLEGLQTNANYTDSPLLCQQHSPRFADPASEFCAPPVEILQLF
jgi:hypothetical protein